MTRFTIYQNQSLSKRGNQMFFLTTFCVSFSIALAFAWQGLWLIVPFAGLEMLALGLALYWCINRLSRIETITVSDKEVSLNVEQQNCKKSSCTFPKAWARATVLSPQATTQKPQLWLEGNRSKVEIGAFLGDREKIKLASAINKSIQNRSWRGKDDNYDTEDN